MIKTLVRNEEDGQVVLLPKEFQFEGVEEVYVRRDRPSGDVVLCARPESWEAFFARSAEHDDVPEDFMFERNEGMPCAGRDPFEEWTDAETLIYEPPSEQGFAPPRPCDALSRSDIALSLDFIFRTTQCDRLRQSVICGDVNFEDAVRAIVNKILNIGVSGR